MGVTEYPVIVKKRYVIGDSFAASGDRTILSLGSMVPEQLEVSLGSVVTSKLVKMASVVVASLVVVGWFATGGILERQEKIRLVMLNSRRADPLPALQPRTVHLIYLF